MRIIRIVHAGSVAFALSLPMVGLFGGCDGGGGSSSAPTSAGETPEQAAARGKNIQDAYKTKPPDTQKKVDSAGGKK